MKSIRKYLTWATTASFFTVNLLYVWGGSCPGATDFFLKRGLCSPDRPSSNHLICSEISNGLPNPAFRSCVPGDVLTSRISSCLHAGDPCLVVMERRFNPNNMCQSAGGNAGQILAASVPCN